MTKRPILIVTLIAITFMAPGAVYIMRPTAEASEPIQAITLDSEQEAEMADETTAVSDTQKANTGTDRGKLADLEERTGLNIKRCEVGEINFLRDTAKVKIYYEDSKKPGAISSWLDTTMERYGINDDYPDSFS